MLERSYQCAVDKRLDNDYTGVALCSASWIGIALDFLRSEGQVARDCGAGLVLRAHGAFLATEEAHSADKDTRK